MRATVKHGSSAWVPLGFVAVTLVLLVGTPYAVSRRVRRLRENITDVADEARLLVGNLEVAFAGSLVAPSTAVTRPPLSSASAPANVVVSADERALDSVVTRLDPEAVERLVALRTAEQRWRSMSQPTHPAAPSSTAHAIAPQEALDVLASAESLDRYLYEVATRGKQEVRRLERIDLYSAVGLSAIALVALTIVVWLERRMRDYATEADDRAAKLARSVELRATLIHGVVHDVKNPLGAASGYADLLEDGLAGPLSEQQREMVRRMKKLVGTAQQTVAELVDLARVDAGEYPIDRRETDLTEVVREVVGDHRARATQKNIELTLETVNEPPSMMTDPVRVRHVVENLITNAIKYTPEGGTIAASISVEPGNNGQPEVRVSVRDTGPGIPDEYRERIFDPFFRVPSAEQAAPGGGMGLAISRRIARLLGGDIVLADAGARGSTFTLLLPMAESTMAARESQIPQSPVERS